MNIVDDGFGGDWGPRGPGVAISGGISNSGIWVEVLLQMSRFYELFH